MNYTDVMDISPYDPRPEIRSLILEALQAGELSTRAIFAAVSYSDPLVRWVLEEMGDAGELEARHGPRRSILWRITGTPVRARATDAFHHSSPGHEVV